MSADKVNFKMKVLSVAPLLGEAIKRIHEGRSVGELFTQKLVDFHLGIIGTKYCELQAEYVKFIQQTCW
ncbi:MAG: hypothetical protein Ct9H300mP19_17110 [Dehalococcoidia bacterium]|nr:MAG: hypothetical protein Ct9H300mP19_17110 [Dehalococcoidia bacterium]